jgi:hypothetical protein
MPVVTYKNRRWHKIQANHLDLTNDEIKRIRWDDFSVTLSSMYETRFYVPRGEMPLSARIPTIETVYLGWPDDVKGYVLAFMSGQHPRIGEKCPLRSFPDNVLEIISQTAFQ